MSVHVDSHHLFTNSLGAHCQAALSAAAENSLQTPLAGALLCGVGSCCQQPAALGSRSNEPCLAQASSGPYPNTLSSLLLPLASTLLGFGLLGHLIFFLGFPESTPAAHPVSQPAFTLEAHLSHIWLKQFHGLVLTLKLDCFYPFWILVLIPGHPLLRWSLFPASVFLSNPSRLLLAHQVTWLLSSCVLLPDL